MAQAAFLSLLKTSVVVREPTTALTQDRNRYLEDYDATSDSPINARVQPMSASSRQDPFFGRYPEAAYRMFCATSVTLKVGHLLSWTDPEGNTVWAQVLGEPENAGGESHHYEVPLVDIEEPPSGVT